MPVPPHGRINTKERIPEQQLEQAQHQTLVASQASFIDRDRLLREFNQEPNIVKYKNFLYDFTK